MGAQTRAMSSLHAGCRWLLILVLLVTGPAVHAVQRALLVGVSELVNQPPALWLQAPRNDVILMRDTLLKQGFSATDMTLLADGVAGAALPEAALVHAALTRMLQASQAGDFVLLYFSGHGTRFKDAAKPYQEPDGLAEHFLARDARGLDASLAGGIRDVDVEAWVKAFLAKDVFVWAVFDTCSAASMTRGATEQASAAVQDSIDEVRFRGVRASQLARGAAIGTVLPVSAVPAVPGPVSKARYVAFFASESHQVTPELRLPRQGRDARPQGLLTWAIADALGRKPATWRDLWGGVLALYPPVIDELEKRFPTRELPSPVAEGALDMGIFSSLQTPVSTRPVWMARRTGGSLTARVGRLDGLESAQEVRVVATLADGTVRFADARLGAVESDAVRMPVPAVLEGLPGTSTWSISPLAEPLGVALAVGADPRWLQGLALDYPASVRHTPEGPVDVRIRTVDAVAYRLEGVSAALLAGAVQAQSEVLPDAAALRRRLQALAQLKWYVRLAELARDGAKNGDRDSALDGFSAVFEVTQGERVERSERVYAGAHLSLAPAGEQAFVRVRNTSGQSLDMVIMAIGPRGEIRHLYPADPGETNRFEQGTPQSPAVKRFPLPVWGEGRVVLVASLAQPQSPPRLFGVAVRDDSADTRLRGQLAPDRARQIFAAAVPWDSGSALAGARR